jgi:flagellar biosynthesis/type III secretory pathway protein FliH
MEGKKIMKLKMLVGSAALGLLVMAGSAVTSSAQGNSGWAHEKNRVRKEQKRFEKEEARRYRVYRNGSYYQTDYRGAELLRQAVNQGYQQGYRQGQLDRRYGRNSGYYGSSIYRSGTFGYRTYVDRSQYQYYFQQGFQRGYQDGFYSQSRYGYYSGGKWNILANILGSILNIQQY